MGMFDFLGGIAGDIGSAIGVNETAALNGENEADLQQWKANINDLNPIAGKYAIKDMGNSAFKGLSTDPRTRQYQMQALQKMSGMANAGGLDPESRAALSDARASTFSDEKAQRGALENSLNARGLMGSGAELSGLLQAGQAGSNADAMAGLHAAADARQRAIQAQQGLLTGASGVRGQDWGEAAQRAAAEDQAAKFNAEQTNARFGAGLKQQELYGKATGAMNNFRSGQRAETIAMDQGVGKDIGSVIGTAANGAYGGLSGLAGSDQGGGSGMGGSARNAALSRMSNGSGQKSGFGYDPENGYTGYGDYAGHNYTEEQAQQFVNGGSSPYY